MRSSAVACGRVRSRAVFRGLVYSCAVRCGRVRFSAVPCGRVRSSAVECGRVRSRAVVCGRVPSCAILCGRVRSRAVENRSQGSLEARALQAGAVERLPDGAGGTAVGAAEEEDLERALEDPTEKDESAPSTPVQHGKAWEGDAIAAVDVHPKVGDLDGHGCERKREQESTVAAVSKGGHFARRACCAHGMECVPWVRMCQITLSIASVS